MYIMWTNILSSLSIWWNIFYASLMILYHPINDIWILKGLMNSDGRRRRHYPLYKVGESTVFFYSSAPMTTTIRNKNVCQIKNAFYGNPKLFWFNNNKKLFVFIQFCQLFSRKHNNFYFISILSLSIQLSIKTNPEFI